MTRIGHSSLSHRLYHHITCGLVLWIVPVNSVVMFQQLPLDLNIGTWMIRLSDQTSHPGPPALQQSPCAVRRWVTTLSLITLGVPRSAGWTLHGRPTPQGGLGGKNQT